MDESLLRAWYFHLPNYVLAALIWTLIGRFGMSLIVPPDWDNYIWRFFRRSTDWLIHGVAFVTPRLVAPGLLPLVAAFWLFVLRAGMALVLLPSVAPPVAG